MHSGGDGTHQCHDRLSDLSTFWSATAKSASSLDDKQPEFRTPKRNLFLGVVRNVWRIIHRPWGMCNPYAGNQEESPASAGHFTRITP